MRVIVIGDVHGCLFELVDLLDACGVNPDDRVIFVGDLVDRGPDSRAVVDLVMKHEFECVLGNHEEKHLRYHEECMKQRRKQIQNDDHRRTYDALSAGQFDFLKALPRFIDLPEHNTTIVHAGVIPDVPIEEQSNRILLHAQMIAPPENRHGYWTRDTETWWPSKVPPEKKDAAKFWTLFYNGDRRIVFGHSVMNKPYLTDKIGGIDTGAVFGHTLTALILPDWRTVSVPARKDWWGGKKRALYSITDDISCFS